MAQSTLIKPDVQSWPSTSKSSLWWVGGLALGTSLLVGCSPGQSQVGADSSYEAQLAQHLSQTDSTMYGAYWCPHCADQKAIFNEAVAQVPYVECAADGENAEPQLCEEKGIRGYPTWEIGGQLYPGTKSLDELATMSGFAAPPSSSP